MAHERPSRLNQRRAGPTLQESRKAVIEANKIRNAEIDAAQKVLAAKLNRAQKEREARAREQK